MFLHDRLAAGLARDCPGPTLPPRKRAHSSRGRQGLFLDISTILRSVTRTHILSRYRHGQLDEGFLPCRFSSAASQYSPKCASSYAGNLSCEIPSLSYR